MNHAIEFEPAERRERLARSQLHRFRPPVWRWGAAALIAALIAIECWGAYELLRAFGLAN